VRRAEGESLNGFSGSGVGIAVLDSGIYKDHHSFGSRVAFSKDFTGENRTDDPYGHGTHVASLIAGNNHVSNGAYTALRPERSSSICVCLIRKT
jgi:subtilisin family serine protease